MTSWDVLSGQSPVPPAVISQLTDLRAALPGYEVIVTRRDGRFRFEAIRRQANTGLWCVISTDPADLWHELATSAQPDAHAL